ncbi:MAG: hypothetical protein IE890_00920 [Arcobacter sp.]|nr:hypothetical protein [Arcobacter sp.]
MKKIRKRNKLKQKLWKIAAYDIETWGLNANKFALGVCMWQEKDGRIEKETFFNKEEMALFMTSRKFKGYRWYAHNGGSYDLVGLFGNYLNNENFKVLINSGRLISAVYMKSNYKIHFLDSLNIFNSSLSKIGDALKMPKGITPEKFITGIEEELTEEDIYYCELDVEILINALIKFNDWLFYKYGINLSLTIASTAQKLFLTAYLKDDLKVSGYDKMFRESYYGGRTEVLSGRNKYVYPVYYYDFNSLYPSVMVEEKYPDPEFLVYLNSHRTDIKYINNFEGVSKVTVHVPENMWYPPLPVKYKGKLIFPVGTFTGSYNHNELRVAMKYGVKIEKIHHTVYSEKTCNYFKAYIEDMYNLRLEFKQDKNDMGNTYTKLLMNSLYGKFAQRIQKSEQGFIFDMPEKTGKYSDKRYKWVFESYKDVEAGIWKMYDSFKKTFVWEEGTNNVISFASYTTSGARIKLFEAVQNVLSQGGKVYYTDTDSLLTSIEIPSSKKLGDVKLEEYGVLYAKAPKVYKFYRFENEQEILQEINDIQTGKKSPDDLKLKGVSKKAIDVTKGIENKYSVTKVIKVKESMRRKLKAGDSIEVIKKMSYEDTKREWNGSESMPINLSIEYEVDEEIEHVIEMMKNKVGIEKSFMLKNFAGDYIYANDSNYSSYPEWVQSDIQEKKSKLRKTDIINKRDQVKKYIKYLSSQTEI